MAQTQLNEELATAPAPAIEETPVPGTSIGILGNYPDDEETRFFLTPEVCGLFHSSGYRLMMERGAAVDISFDDDDYAAYDVNIVDREEAIRADIVLSYRPLRPADVAKMKKDAVLFSMMDICLFDRKNVQAYLDAGVTLACFDNMLSYNDEPVFSNIIDEIDGRAAMIYAQEALSYSGEGKGVLLAGVAGINPCEVLIIGDGLRCVSAAKAALAAGANVTLMNNDISELQKARNACGEQLITCAIHPRVLANKVKSADVIILSNCTRQFEFPKSLHNVVKSNVYFLDLGADSPSTSVPRTVAMGLSNVLVNFFDEMQIKNGFEGMLASTPGMQSGIITYRSKLVDKLIGSFTGLPAADITMMLTPRN